ncbi:hypothetical protein M8494_20230 [Serratia ureilytica]
MLVRLEHLIARAQPAARRSRVKLFRLPWVIITPLLLFEPEVYMMWPAYRRLIGNVSAAAVLENQRVETDGGTTQRCSGSPSVTSNRALRVLDRVAHAVGRVVYVNRHVRAERLSARRAGVRRRGNFSPS